MEILLYLGDACSFLNFR